MSTSPAPAPAAPHAPELTAKSEIVIVSHSSLFYWWPVWAVGFILALITLFAGDRLAVVPEGTKAVAGQNVIGLKEVDVLVVPQGRKLERDKEGNLLDPHLRIASSKNLGVTFCIVLLLVITITNIPLRGLWSVIVIVIVIFGSAIFAVLDWWGTIFEKLSFLDIRINLGGYFLISAVLFGLWLIVFVFFDRQIYMIFTPGQLRVRLEIGDAETAYDTTGMTIMKQRSDLFRHWILGLGSGDLIVKTSGAQHHHFDMHNVLFLGRKVREIEEMLRARQVVSGQNA
ncbi:MAG: hypothetical protein U0793_17080 [Gemmataceae bacterium]